MTASGLIDVHAHFTTESYVAQAKAAGHRRADGMPEEFWPRWTVARQLDLMNEAGIATAMLSMSSPGVHFGNDRAACLLAREVNESAAEIIRRHPRRFGLFATLPLPAIDGALEEITYSFDELGAAGVILLSNSAGRYLGHPQLSPVLAELDRRAAVVLLHPTSCVGHENVSCDRPRPMIEFMFDTARSVVDLVLSGAAGRYPHLKIIVPHAGGVLPLLADRVERFRSISTEPGDGRPFKAAMARLYYDLAGDPSPVQLDALRALSSPDQLLYGSDCAWTREEQILRTIRMLDATSARQGETWRQLTTRNAERLLTEAALPEAPGGPAQGF
jgi:predicted TIM-barrel fold metal-dependent hydrolase